MKWVISPPLVRLQKYLAGAGIASRRASERLITEGRILVNGRPAELGQSVDPLTDRVEVDGRVVRLEEEKVYILLNKPAGVITSSKDTHQRKTVLDLVKKAGPRLFPVGRLDYDTEGALLLTNDGELAFRLTHPRYQVDKVYLTWVEGRMAPETAARIEEGVPLDDGVTAPAQVLIMHADESSTLVKITIHEGRKREVRRMCAAVGHQVRQLQRVAIGSVRLKGLKPGEWRHLTDGEIQDLRRQTGLT